jgi:hypothetical protein
MRSVKSLLSVLKKSFPIILFLISASIKQATCQGDASGKKITAIRLNEKINIDGDLSESIWKRPGFTELYQQEPHQGEIPSQRTEVWVAYDNDAIYFAAKYYDNRSDSILARLVRRDFVWGDPSDGTVLYLDSYGDKRNGYFFYVNAAGTLADGLLENDNKQTDLSWDAVWEGVPRIDKDGWSVEMRIPYSQLRFKQEDIQVWGINVERYISRKAETAMIAYTPRNENGFASRFPSLVGIEGIKSSAHLELLPYVTGKAEYSESELGNPFRTGHKYTPGAGLDLRAGLGSSLTLNGTINPDFGQVELDPAVVNLTDVETAFQEKRPFFTEGVNIYRFGNGGSNNNANFNWPGANIFYSRRIGRTPQGRVPASDYSELPNGTSILGAAKISGTIRNNWKIGTLHAVTQREFAKTETEGLESRSEVEPLTYYGVLRMQRDFHEGLQGFGILSTYTNRNFKDTGLKNYINNDALVTGTDGWIFLDKNRTYVLTGWTAVSRVTGDPNRMIALQRGSGHYFQRPDAKYLGVDSSAKSLTGTGGRIMINKNRGKFSFNSAVGWLSPSFEINDLGFGSYSDYLNTHLVLRYRANEPTKYYQNAGVNAAVYTSFDFGGNRTGEGYFLGSYITFKDLSGANVSYFYNPQSLNARRTRGGPLTLNPSSQSFNIALNSDNRKWWVVSAGSNLTWGENANSKEVYANIEFKVTPTLTVQFGPDFSLDKFNAQWVGAFADPTSTDTYGKRYVFANLNQKTLAAEFRSDWIINPRLSFQVYMQPYVVSGKYSNFKALSKPKSFDFLTYGENGSVIDETLSPGGEITSYRLDPDGSGPAEGRIILNPDFNYISLRGNAVLRWEYKPGSSLYLVWTQNREINETNGDFNLGHSLKSARDAKPVNIFLLKVSFWF